MTGGKWLLLMTGLLLVYVEPGWARRLTAAEYATLNTDITVTHQAEFATQVAGNEDQAIADAYNAPAAAPDYWVWKTNLAKSELFFGVSVDNTSFTFKLLGYITMDTGKQHALDQLFQPPSLYTSCALKNVRIAFNQIYTNDTPPDTAEQTANKTHLGAICRRTVLRIERLYVTNTGGPNQGNGQGTTAQPGFLTFEGPITATDIACAFGRGGAAC